MQIFAHLSILTFLDRSQSLSDIEHHISRPKLWNANEQFVGISWQVESQLVEKQNEWLIDENLVLLGVVGDQWDRLFLHY